MTTYEQFIEAKSQIGSFDGFKPVFMPDFLFDFQKSIVEWAVLKGKAAVFADCGLGKTAMQLVWGQNVVEQTCKPALILTPLAVAPQTVLEAAKFGMECAQSRDGKVAAPLTVTNYQQLHKFNPADFSGCVCDESSILKSFDGKTRGEITAFMSGIRYRSLWTATAAPNDYMELGTSSEALGQLKYREMLSRFFNHDGGETSKWRLKKHAAKHIFWRWVCSWARALRAPSDLGFSDEQFILPPLRMVEHTVWATSIPDGMLFQLPAIGLDEQREERRRTIKERCELAASLITSTKAPAISWCQLNPEGDLLEDLMPDAIQVSGSDSDEAKEEKFMAFVNGQARVLVTKPSIAGFGLNFQHCAHQTFFPSHSFEQWYQAVRRSWRFGQKRPVTIDVISSEGEAGVLANMNRKAEQAANMFERLVSLMNSEIRVERTEHQTTETQIPQWL